jgi:hypothetical protein
LVCYQYRYSKITVIYTSSLNKNCHTTVQNFMVKHGMSVELGPLYSWLLITTAWFSYSCRCLTVFINR